MQPPWCSGHLDARLAPAMPIQRGLDSWGMGALDINAQAHGRSDLEDALSGLRAATWNDQHHLPRILTSPVDVGFAHTSPPGGFLGLDRVAPGVKGWGQTTGSEVPPSSSYA